MSDNELESALRRSYRDSMVESCEGCRDDDGARQDERIVDLLLGELDSEASEGLREQIVRCRRCAESFRRARDLHRETAPRLAAEPAPARRDRSGQWTAAAVAAVVLFGFGLAVAILNQRPEPPAIGGDALRAPAIAVRPLDGARLDRAPAELRWRAQTGAQAYVVALLDASARELWRSEALEEPRAELPESVAAALEPGSYGWRVEVTGRVQRSRLGVFRFEIEAPRRE